MLGQRLLGQRQCLGGVRGIDQDAIRVQTPGYVADLKADLKPLLGFFGYILQVGTVDGEPQPLRALPECLQPGFGQAVSHGKCLRVRFQMMDAA
jgi:hypothetical protein